MYNQPMLIAAFNTIRAVADTPSKTTKIALLRQGNSHYLTELLFHTYNRYRTYRVLNLDLPEKYNAVTPDIMDDLGKLLGRLAAHTLGTNEAKRQITGLLASCTKEDARIIANVITRDLRAGIDSTLINIAFPGLIPVFGIQLAKPLDSWDRVTYPVIVDEKIDGIRCVPVYDGERVTFYSRNGFEFETGMDAFAEEIPKLLPGIPKVFDAEFCAYRFNEHDPVCRKHEDGNWAFEYAKAISRRKEINPEEIRQYFKLFIWDAVDLDYFTSQGKRGRCLPIEERKIELLGMFERHDNRFQNIELLPNYLMHSRQEILAYMKELKLQRKEGCMLKLLGKPYTFGKNYNQMKLKHFVEGDFRVLDAYEGEGKYQGMLGGVVIGTDDGLLRSNMGSGFSDSDRIELWVEYLAGRLIGRVVEVQIKDITADGSLQLPTLNRFRDDKNTTDTLAELQEKLAGQEDEK